MSEDFDENRKYRIWNICTVALLLFALGLFAAAIICIDPFFHYHAPLEGLAYPINNERYQNDGITRHFEYEGIITGTSMTENFKTSEAEELFGVSFIKVSFAGGRYKEINDNLKRAFEAGKNVRYIIRCLDTSLLALDKDAYETGIDFPDYLYNDNPFDDVNYIFSKAVLNLSKDVIANTRAGGVTTSFDDYANWNASSDFGAEAVLRTYTLGEPAEYAQELTDEEKDMILENIRQNVTELADEHPETEFYLFFPPYSICYWDMLDHNGQTDWRIDAEQTAIEELLTHPNIRLYSFCGNFDLVCDLDNYRDHSHYGEWVNTWILEQMREGNYLLTADNYQEYLENIREFYGGYDYGSLHRQTED